jgi:chromosome segregation ATPase
MKELKSTQDAKVKRILLTGAVLIFVCIVCIFVSIRHIDRYWSKVAETSVLKQKLEELEQDVKKMDIKTRELEVVRYDLSLEKKSISKEYLIIKERYKSLGNTMKSLEKDVNDLQKISKFIEKNDNEPLLDEKESSKTELRLLALQNQNDKLVNALAAKTKEKMILKIALESQAKGLGLSENYDPELKEILKRFVTSLQ